MRLLWIGGDHPRHLFYANRLARQVELSGAILEHRESLIPQPPEGIEERDQLNFIRHFSKRELAEQKYFGKQEPPACPTLEVSPQQLNSERSAAFVRQIDPEVILIFGTGLIKDPLYSSLPTQSVNLHLGISPRYRGAATLFWPFYFMEPGYAGSTFHYILPEPDAGDIIHQVVPDLSHGDGIHDVACKTVIASAEAALRLLELFAAKGFWRATRQRGTGKNFLSTDFKPAHLRVIYDLFNDEMVAHYLEGKLASKSPKLVRQY